MIKSKNLLIKQGTVYGVKHPLKTTVAGARLSAVTNLKNTQNKRRTFVQKANLNNFDPREAHRELAREVTTLLHGADQTQKVEAAAKALFGQGEIRDLDIETLKSALAELPKTKIKKGAEIPSWVDLITSSGVVESKSAARRVIKEGGAYLNNGKITGEDFTPKSSDLLHGQFLLLRKGKRDLVAVEITE